ncbi:uncharacterized protein LOC120428959 isoform X2 [Culex pipiens pallens]|uniref:uncharacterized protein LOC120428959 isoform X2 n=1 Tax=Culex pipiens pallens TaxID=42434 RepID=UPI0019539B00|nr:uncharacterized protein LOC120428959 isoform X2 [Culex pipiens pallens]
MVANLISGGVHSHRHSSPVGGDKNAPRRRNMVVSRAASGSSRWPLIVLVASWCLVATLAAEESATSSVIVDLNYLNQTIISDGDEIGNLTITPSLNPEPATSRANKRPLFSTGNKLWDSLIAECIKKPTFACIQKNVYSFLGESLDVGDFNVSNRLVFTRNRVDFTKYTREANEEEQQHDEEVDNEIPDARGDFEPTSPIEEVTTALHDKTVKFMLTHDVNIRMPEVMFDGAIFRIEPRSIEGNGMLAKLEFVPRTAVQARADATPRILFKKIKKFFQGKLLLAFLAVILIIKIIKIKVMWLLPLLVGVGTAKKLVLKFLLFLFPALSHIFKLCTYYHQSYHKPNFHHHHHQIKHLHTFFPHEHGSHNLPELIYTKPPTGHPAEYIHGAPVPPHAHFQPELHYETSGPGLGSEIVVPKPVYGPPPSSAYGPPGYSAKRNPTGAASSIAATYASAPTAEEQLVREAQRQEAYRIAQEQKLIAKQQQIVNQQAYAQEGVTPRPVDPFYSPILARLDKVFNSLGIVEENCRERLVCAMYKSPIKYSPHSNYVSAELSRDATELQKPTATNAAVIRFYRYVQAARDGQDQRDCRQVYSLCTINIDKKKK